jgi:hypothetical protein
MQRMSNVDTETLIRDIVRLRHAELEGAPDSVVDVREDLEEMVGPTIGRALSSRILGITQTALDRQIARGAVPAVVAPSGRREIPLAELVRLALDLDEVRRSGDAPRPLAAALRRRRERARGLELETRLGASLADRPGGEALGLAFHRAVAQRLDQQLIADARRRLRRWRRRGSIDERWARDWEEVLSRPIDGIRDAITADDPQGRDLRQSSPFAGALSHDERQRLLELVTEAT